IAPIIFTSPPPRPPIAKGGRSTTTATSRPLMLPRRPSLPKYNPLRTIPTAMPRPERRFGMRRLRTSHAMQSAAKTSVVTVTGAGVIGFPRLAEGTGNCPEPLVQLWAALWSAADARGGRDAGGRSRPDGAELGAEGHDGGADGHRDDAERDAVL